MFKTLVYLSAVALLVASLLLPIAASAPQVEIGKKQLWRAPPPWAPGPPAEEEGLATEVISYPVEDRFAIIIGIADYAGDEYDLRYTDDDALWMNKTLVEVYGYDPANIILLVNESATKAWIEGNITLLKALEDSEDEIVFYFSGHGARGAKQDADKEAIDEAIVTHELDFIWDGELVELFSEFESSRIFLMFDSCYAGGMTDLATDGRIICMASTERGVAYESAELEMGVFSYYFTHEGMFLGKADATPKDGDVTVEEAFDYADPLVIEYTWGLQDPTASDGFTNDLLL